MNGLPDVATIFATTGLTTWSGHDHLSGTVSDRRGSFEAGGSLP